MVNKMPVLSASFYQNHDVVQVAKQLVGCKLCTHLNGKFTAGIIVETEAYDGLNDKACHAYPNKRTPRTEVMYQPGGVAYVYFVYGMHYLFNVVTNVAGKADAVLIRAIEPTNGLPTMLQRRQMHKLSTTLTAGPARLSKALGIDNQLNGLSLTEGKQVWIEPRARRYRAKIAASERIGIDYAGEDARLPWRFSIIGNTFVSK